MQIFTIFHTDFGFFAVISTNRGVFASILPVKVEAKCRDLLMSKVGAENGCISDRVNGISVSNEAIVQDDGCFAELTGLVRGYYKGEKVDFSTVKVDFDRIAADIGDKSGFGVDVLRALRTIRHGKTVTYGELARIAGRPGAARAVGTVLSKNPVPLILPCHRVIRADGSIGRFSAIGGKKTKKTMLLLEN